MKLSSSVYRGGLKCNLTSKVYTCIKTQLQTQSSARGLGCYIIFYVTPDFRGIPFLWVYGIKSNSFSIESYTISTIYPENYLFCINIGRFYYIFKFQPLLPNPKDTKSPVFRPYTLSVIVPRLKEHAPHTRTHTDPFLLLRFLFHFYSLYLLKNCSRWLNI